MMTAQQQLSPNTDAMAEFLEHAFGGYLDGLQNGLIEIACCANQGDKPNERWTSHLFGTDEIDEAVAFASEQNEKRLNIYFAPALRHPDSPRDKRGNKAAVIGTLMLWAEWDDGASFDAAKEKFAFAKPTAGVITGIVPNKRAQAFWRLQEAIKHPDDIDSALNGLCVVLGGDPKVVHADGLMRLPGSISWRKLNKPERIDELTRLEVGKTDRPAAYPVEQLIKAYPPQARHGNEGTFAAPVIIQRTSALGLGGQIQDGREGYMRNTILACLIEFVGTNGAAPSADELFQAAWPQYEANVDFSRPGRGQQEFRIKCVYTVQRFNAGRIPGLPTLESAVAAFAKKKPVTVNQPHLPTADLSDEPFAAITLRGDPPPRKWIVPDWLPQGHVTSLYGDGGTGKSLLGQQLANAVATGQPWLGLPVTQGPALFVFAEDDKDEIWRRQHGIEAANGMLIKSPGCGLENLHLWPRVGFDNMLQVFDAKKMVSALTPFYERLAHKIEAIQPILVGLDTAADMFGGEENVRVQVNHFIKATLGALCVRYGCTIVLFAHPSAAGLANKRGDGGSTAWNNSVRSRWYLTKPDGGSADERVLSRMKANYAKAGEDQKIDLVWDEGVFKVNADGRQKVSTPKAVEILKDVEAAFDEGQPFGASSNSARPLVVYMATRYELKPDTCWEYLRAWIGNGTLIEETVSRGSRRKGLRVTRWPE